MSIVPEWQIEQIHYYLIKEIYAHAKAQMVYLRWFKKLSYEDSKRKYATILKHSEMPTKWYRAIRNIRMVFEEYNDVEWLETPQNAIIALIWHCFEKAWRSQGPIPNWALPHLQGAPDCKK